MKMKWKLIAALMALLTAVLPLCSCGKDPEGGEQGTTPPIATEKEHLDNLPSDLDFNNDILYILYADFNGDADIGFKDLEGTPEGDTVDSSVFARNLVVEERLDLDLDFTKAEQTGPQGYADLVKQLYMSEDSTYDVIYHYGQHAATQSMQGYFQAWNNVPYVDLNADYWYTAQMENLSLGLEAQYLLIGDMVISNFTNMNCVFFNKDDYLKLFPDAEKSLYQMVYDGEWTWENFFALVEDAYTDDGDGLVNATDYFGANFESKYRTGVYYPYGCGLLYTARDDDGYLKLDMNNDRTQKMVEELYKFVNSTTFTIDMETINEAKPAFLGKRMLFWTIFLGQARDIKAQATFEWGILPFPKLDSTVEHNTSVAKGAGVYVIPRAISSDRFEIIGAAMEALCSQSAKSVLPYYYEYILKANQAGNPEDAAMIDFLRDHLWFDCLFWIGTGIGSVDVIFRDVIFASKTNNFSGYWAGRGFVYETLLGRLVDSYKAALAETA